MRALLRPTANSPPWPAGPARRKIDIITSSEMPSGRSHTSELHHGARSIAPVSFTLAAPSSRTRSGSSTRTSTKAAPSFPPSPFIRPRISVGEITASATLPEATAALNSL